MVIALSFQVALPDIRTPFGTCVGVRILTGSLACPIVRLCHKAAEMTGGGAMPSLSGKVAIVTGASRGIGAAAAVALGEAGAAVVLAARSLAQAEAHAQQINAAGGKAAAIV